MAAVQISKSKQVRARLNHPVIDSDGHTVEFEPAVMDTLREVGGPGIVERYKTKRTAGLTASLGGMLNWHKLPPAQRHAQRLTVPPWWALPARNTLDRATAMLPKLLHERLDDMGIDVSILRYFTVYGPAGRPDMAVFRFIHWIEEGQPVVLFGDGRQERDFTYVDDVARATLSALRPLGCEVVNVGGARPVSMLDLIALIERATGKAAVVERREAPAADAPATWADVSKARDLLNWAPRTGLEDGIAACVAWRREHRALAAAALGESAT